MAIGLSRWFKKTFLGYEDKRVRARDEDGRYVGDDKSTPDVNEAYTTVSIKTKKKISESARSIRRSFICFYWC